MWRIETEYLCLQRQQKQSGIQKHVYYFTSKDSTCPEHWRCRIHDQKTFQNTHLGKYEGMEEIFRWKGWKIQDIDNQCRQEGWVVQSLKMWRILAFPNISLPNYIIKNKLQTNVNTSYLISKCRIQVAQLIAILEQFHSHLKTSPLKFWGKSFKFFTSIRIEILQICHKISICKQKMQPSKGVFANTLS